MKNNDLVIFFYVCEVFTEYEIRRGCKISKILSKYSFRWFVVVLDHSLFCEGDTGVVDVLSIKKVFH